MRPWSACPPRWHSGSGSFCCVSNPGTCAPTGSNVLTTMSPAFHLRQIVEPCPAPCTVFTNAAAATGVVDSCASPPQGRGRFRGLGLGTLRYKQGLADVVNGLHLVDETDALARRTGVCRVGHAHRWLLVAVESHIWRRIEGRPPAAAVFFRRSTIASMRSARSPSSAAPALGSATTRATSLPFLKIGLPTSALAQGSSACRRSSASDTSSTMSRATTVQPEAGAPRRCWPRWRPRPPLAQHCLAAHRRPTPRAARQRARKSPAGGRRWQIRRPGS